MKRLLLISCCVILLSSPGTIPAAAQGPQGAGSEHKHSWFSFHFHWPHRHPHVKTAPLYNVPKSVGWWHKNPGPAGAGVK